MSVELKSIKSSDGGTDNMAFENGEQITKDGLKTNDIVIDVKDGDHEKGNIDDGNIDQGNCCARATFSIQKSVSDVYTNHKQFFKTAFCILIILLYFAYFTYALYYHFGDEPSVRLLVCTILTVFLIIGKIILHLYEDKFDKFWEKSIRPCLKSKAWHKAKKYISWFLKIAVFLTISIYIIVDVLIDHPRNLISLAGLAIFVILFYVTSVNPAKINWHPVFWGLALQFIFALLILRTRAGFEAFNWCGERVTEFLTYSDAGAAFVFGDGFQEHFFAFKVLPLVIFFYTMISVMYYLGVMQFIVRNLGRALSFLMGTTPAESLNAAGNIFVGMTEAPLMIQPLLGDMTVSELHAVCTGGFATIAGSVLGAFINFGAPASHLLSASVMSAPAALAMSKLAYPEVEVSKSTAKDYYKMGKAKERNIIEAASAGATNSIKIVGSIAVNVLAFLSVLKFIDTTLTWFGQRVGLEEFTFEFICSYVLYPFAYFMGVTPDDSRTVAALIGVKSFTNEFVAYRKLGFIIANKKNFTDYTTVLNHTDWYYKGSDIILPMVNQTLANGILERKSEVIATYALCGFSNFGSMGILLGALGALVPSRKTDLSKIILRAMIAGNAACLMTGCIAGLFYKEYGV